MAAPPLALVAAAIAALAALALVVFAFRRWWLRRRRQRQRRAVQAAAAVPTPVAVQVEIRAFLFPCSSFESPGGEAAVLLMRIGGPGVSWKIIVEAWIGDGVGIWGVSW